MVDITSIADHFLQNQFATGLGLTAVLGGLLYQLKSLPAHLWRLFLLSVTVEMSVSSKDEAFVWLDKWLAAQPYAKRTTRVRLKSFDNNPDDDDVKEWMLTPGNGHHWFFWRNRIIYLNRETSSPEKSGAGVAVGRNGGQTETLEFRVLGRHQDVLRELVKESRSTAVTDTLVPLRMWTNDWWRRIKGKAPRSLDTITLKEGQLERIIEDLDRFERSSEWYAHRGIPYRRGYLFSGPPGTGKTSVVLALAGYMGRPVCVLNLGSIKNDDSLFEAIADAPPKAIILLEDIDCATASQSREDETKSKDKEKDDEDGESKITKAGLYNALDGITTPDGRIFVMTTNYPERLDAALIRPGRADLHEVFDYFGPAEQVRMADRFYGKDRFLPLEALVSPARMQAAFTMFPNNPEGAREFLSTRV